MTLGFPFRVRRHREAPAPHLTDTPYTEPTPATDDHTDLENRQPPNRPLSVRELYEAFGWRGLSPAERAELADSERQAA